MAGARRQNKKQNRKPVSSRPVQPLTDPPARVQAQYPFLKDFLATRWDKIPLRNAFGVYGLSLYAGKVDYREVAVESLTEGFDDKDVDLCLISRESGTAFIAQCYAADQWDLGEAPSNKADDLLTGLSWLLRQPVAEVPIGLRKKATELQDAVGSGDITTVHLLYIHNCKSSKNVGDSLKTVAAGARLLIARENVSIIAEELSLEKMQYDYDALTKTIVVDDELELSAEHRIREAGDGWKAVATTVPGSLLHDLRQKHGNNLFSANIRGFLG